MTPRKRRLLGMPLAFVVFCFSYAIGVGQFGNIELNFVGKIISSAIHFLAVALLIVWAMKDAEKP